MGVAMRAPDMEDRIAAVRRFNRLYTRHLGAQLQGAAAPNASGAGGWFARLPPENGGKSWDISLKGGNCCGKNVYFRGKRGFLPL